jgi:hypothetical protein
VRRATTPLDQTWMQAIQNMMDYGRGEAGWNAYFESFKQRAKTPAPLPEAFRSLPPSSVIDMDETRCTLFKATGAKIVEDPKASNGVAMLVPKAPQPSWGVQAFTKLLGTYGGFGRYHVYAVVRCELQADSGDAFVVGLYDLSGNKGLGAVSFPIGQGIDANLDSPQTIIKPGGRVTDGEYHLYDLGVYDLPHSQMYFWVGTTTGDMYVDRFLFVKEP